MPRLADRYKDDLAAAEQALLNHVQVPSRDYSWNVEGYRSVVDHARTLVDSAGDEIVMAVWPEEARALSSTLSKAEARDVAVTTLCLAGCIQECGNCQGNIYRYRLSPDEETHWLIVAVDGKEMLAGEIDNHPEEENAYAIRTTHKMLVDLAGWYVRNSIALATLVSDLGDRLPAILSPRAAGVLASLKQGTLTGGWLEQIRAALNRPPTIPSDEEVA
jgi:hypothetical protein